ncbi:MAG: anti-sigma factor antagonist [Eubacterium sp.]|nr:anti-sigma factor antagonist [Eubacterium sp.]
MDMKYIVEDGSLVISLEGRIDSANSPQVEEEIQKIRDAEPDTPVVLDCEKLEYISSAGLRVLLRLQQETGNVKLINVSSEVYEIFDMTGFAEIMEVHKAYRVISVEGCEVIGKGANGKIYRIDRDTIVKVYLNPDALPEINRERELARTAFVLGVPTAIPYDVVKIEGGGYGSVFELLSAKSLAQLLESGEKTVDETAKMSIDLLKIIHGTTVRPDSMPDMKAVALDWADFLEEYLPADLYQKLHSLIADVPDDNHMMHGDYHIKNVMLQNGECLLIDMDTLCHGNPIFELASMYNAYCGYCELDHSISQDFLGIPYETAAELWNKSLRLYLDGFDEEQVKAVEDKAKIVGYTRIMRRRIRRNGFDTEAGRAEIENCKKHLEELLPKVDSLVF